jgi:PDZ domain-containing protein
MDTTLHHNTIGGMVVPGPLTWAPPAAPRKRRAALIGIPLLVVSALLWQASFFTLPYFALAPGSAGPINSLLKVPADRNHPPRGEILLTTVSLKHTTVYDVLQGWLDPDTDVLPEHDVIGDVDPAQYTRLARIDMQDSKQAAVVLALRRLGYTVTEHGTGTLVVNVLGTDVPVAGVLQPGDTIVAIEGKPTPLRQDATAILQTKRPGDVVRLSVLSDKAAEPVTKEVTLGSRTDNSCSRTAIAGAPACLGVELGTRGQQFDLPFDVAIDTQDIGGPSAGLAFTLALLDQLTPGELTGGTKVAVTGTIDFDGYVGDVGGVRQKTAAVLAAGAKVFLVPPGEFKAAKARGGKKLKVIAVATLDEALAALGTIGGDLAAISPNSGQNR